MPAGWEGKRGNPDGHWVLGDPSLPSALQGMQGKGARTETRGPQEGGLPPSPRTWASPSHVSFPLPAKAAGSLRGV